MNPSIVDDLYPPTAQRNGVRKHTLCVIGHVVTMAIMACFFVGCDTTPHYTSDVLKLMSKYGKQGRYDDAIKVGRDWELRFPDDFSTNAFLDQQIALLYLKKASDDSTHKEQWIIDDPIVVRGNHVRLGLQGVPTYVEKFSGSTTD